MNPLSRALAWCLCLLALVGMSACGGSDSSGDSAADTGTSAQKDNDPIVIGVAYSKTGLLSGYDVPLFRALKLQADRINAEGGIDGRQLKVITRDTKSDPVEAKSAAESLIDEGATLIFAPTDYDLGSPAGLAAQKAGLISFSLGAQSLKWGVQGIGDLSYSPSTAAVDEGYAMAEFAHDDHGVKNAVALVDRSLAYNQEVCAGASTRLGELGGKATEVAFKGTDTSFASQISDIKRIAPDGIFMCGLLPSAATALRQIRAAGIDTPVFASAGMDGDEWLKGVPDPGEFYFESFASVFGNDPRDEINDFVAEYKETYGEDMPAGFATNSATGLQAYAEAVEKAGTTDAKAVADELNKLTNFDGLTGPTTFTPEVHITMNRPWAIMTWENGENKFIKYLEPAKAPPFEIPN